MSAAEPVPANTRRVLIARVRWYAGRWPGKPLQAYASDLNSRLGAPMADSALQGLVRAVEREREQWEHTDAWRTRQRQRGAEGGKRSGEARRKRNRFRDAAILRAHAEGMSQRAIAKAHGCSRRTVRDVITLWNPSPR